MSDTGIPLRVIAEVSGHRNLSQLNAYLEVKPEQVLGAVASLSILSPISEGGKRVYDDFNPDPNPRPVKDPKLSPGGE
jgi:integrase/recombinase XerD